MSSHLQQESAEKKPIWMVARTSAFATHWSSPKNTYGPFKDRETAEKFAKGGGWVYDATKEHVSSL